jgi:glycosyltransferase involved in cell wall biosynthesis
VRAHAVSDTVEALRSRLRAARPYLAPDLEEDLPIGSMLAGLAAAVHNDGTDAAFWLLGTAVAAGYPTQAEIIAMRRGLELAGSGEQLGAVLTAIAATASAVRDPDARMRILDGATLVDVDFCARSPHNTGIQRVVRKAMPHWSGKPGVVLAAWSDDATGYRDLSPDQRRLVLEYESGMAPSGGAAPAELLVPWRGRIVLPEVPDRRYLSRQAVLAAASGNALSLIGYDAIPVVSADTVVDDESDRFAHYLEVVKHSHRIACISATTAEEFEGFVEMLPAQGLVGPDVSTVPLPVDVALVPQEEEAADEPVVDGIPLVLMVGSVEPRKNQLGVLSAAQTLWSEGLEFELLFVGGGHSWYLQQFDATLKRLRAAGRRVGVGRGVRDRELAAAYRQARVVVFPSLQEGYGLPVAEALATGTPVITTSYGSTAEIASGGGCLLVDPRDDDDIAHALGRILRDDALHARLSAEALQRSKTTWVEYADALWNDLGGDR